LTPPASPPQRLPRRIRFAAVVCLLLSSLTGFTALRGALELERLSQTKDEAHYDILRFSQEKEPQKERVLAARMVVAHLTAVEPLRESRTLVLGALAVACAFVFVSASRVLQPGGLPLERVRRLLGGAAITTALLRTIDGAQEAVVSQRLGLALADILATLPEFQAAPQFDLKASLPGLALLISVGLTALIAGTFALLGQYFRSDSVREAVLAQDGELAEEED
jgi:hypothetical protein